MIRAAIVLALLVTAAHAETVIDLPRTTTQLALPDAWARVTAPHDAKEIVVLYAHGGGALLAVTRADVPNTDAWIAKKKQGYVDAVERGIKARIAGYKRVARKLVDANGVPALDLVARRKGGGSVVVRMLLFRTYALALAIDVPKGGDVASARAIAKAFAPRKPQPAKAGG